jgi:hypothetical protein
MNEHPLSEDLSKLGNDELDKKYNELSRRWQLARRMGMDEYVMHQLDIMLSGMESEKQRRLMLPEDDNHVVIDTDPIIKKTSEKK